MLNLRLASFLDRQESRARALAEVFGYTPWLTELRAYLGDPRLTREEVWYRYCRLRETDGPKIDAVKTEAEAREFYRTSEYLLYRQIIHRRHSAWRRVLWTMKGDVGCLTEFGGGIAPVAAWCLPKKPAWTVKYLDVPSPHARFGAHRVRALTGPWEWHGLSHVTVALDVFEHLPDPASTARFLVNGLAFNGYLHWNFVPTDHSGLDLASESQRQATVAYLYLASALTLVYREGDYHVSRKR